uniref:Rho GTPase activating protein 27 n=1 Tax=Cavia porcellus TaxID=10141 RepID=A0A286XEM2_CAVPO
MQTAQEAPHLGLAWKEPQALFFPLHFPGVDAPADPVYVNVGRPLARSPRASAAPRPDPAWEAWEEHTDAGSGRRYYYNRDTGATTWEPPGEASPAASPTSAGSRESLESEWDQY